VKKEMLWGHATYLNRHLMPVIGNIGLESLTEAQETIFEHFRRNRQGGGVRS
jgi:hypothetical protein